MLWGIFDTNIHPGTPRYSGFGVRDAIDPDEAGIILPNIAAVQYLRARLLTPLSPGQEVTLTVWRRHLGIWQPEPSIINPTQFIQGKFTDTVTEIQDLTNYFYYDAGDEICLEAAINVAGGGAKRIRWGLYYP